MKSSTAPLWLCQREWKSFANSSKSMPLPIYTTAPESEMTASATNPREPGVSLLLAQRRDSHLRSGERGSVRAVTF
jgi:hypothetical protein